MSLADVAPSPSISDYRVGFLLCAAVACLFLVSAVALVVVLVRRRGRS